MAEASESFVKTCIKYKIDCYLLPSIAGLESTFGKFVWPNSHNAFGWARGFMMFDSWAEGIDTVGAGLRKGYLNKGALTVEDIGPIYSESPTWAIRVNYFINQFEREEEKNVIAFRSTSCKIIKMYSYKKEKFPKNTNIINIEVPKEDITKKREKLLPDCNTDC